MNEKIDLSISEDQPLPPPFFFFSHDREKEIWKLVYCMIDGHKSRRSYKFVFISSHMRRERERERESVCVYIRAVVVGCVLCIPCGEGRSDIMSIIIIVVVVDTLSYTHTFSSHAHKGLTLMMVPNLNLVLPSL